MNPLSLTFDESFVRLQPVYDELDSYLENIREQHGKFWISSPYGGTGKSTMLSYAARYLYKNLPNLRALPIRLKVTRGEDEKTKMPSVQHQFVKGLLKEFLSIDSDLRKAAVIFDLEYAEDIKRELRWLEEHKNGIEKFSQTLADMSVEKLTEKFDQILETGLLPLRNKGVFSKYVLLLDEMDKITVEEHVLSFLSGNQGLFEELYDKFGFVAFFAGHESWVERIRIGDEFNFFLGKVFNVPLFASIDDVRRLVEVNLQQNFSIQPSDIPFTDDAYKKLQELTKGIPRRIIILATEIMNDGALRKVPKIGPGFVEEVLVKEEHMDRSLKYLQKNMETYVKLKRAIEKRVDEVLYIFYNNFREIPKKLDKDLSLRTRTLGIEWSDDEWNDKVLTLTFIGCLEDRGTYRELSKDLVALFDELKDHPEVMGKVLAAAVKRMDNPILNIDQIPKPDFRNAIDSIFEISGKMWFTKDQVLDRFSDRSPVIAYASVRRPKSPQNYINEEFKKAFASYLEQNESNRKLIIVSENAEVFYRKLPSTVKEPDQIILKLNSRELIDSYMDQILDMKECNKQTIDQIDEFLERILSLLSGQKTVVEKGILRKKKRNSLFKELGFSHELRTRINYYLSETKETCPSIGIVRETTSDICRSLFERYIALKATAPLSEITMSRDTPFTNLQKLNEVIANLRGIVEIFDKDFDAEGFKFFVKLDPAKVSKLKILGGKSRLGTTLREEYKAFKTEQEKRGILVEFRVPDDADATAFHDRYLISDEIVYNTPPWNIINKKYGDIKSLRSGPDKRRQFDSCWSRGKDLLNAPP